MVQVMHNGMFHLYLYHQSIEMERAGVYSEAFTQRISQAATLTWETCRRKIYFLTEDDLIDHGLQSYFSNNDENFKQGLEAETFLIEILCGLHSPVTGETEILGQFRQFLNTNATHSWVQKWQPRIQAWFGVVKETRDRFLCGFGSQSYGGYLRRLLAQDKSIQMIGSGSFAEEILPWLVSKNVQVFARDTKKAQAADGPVMKSFSNYLEAGGALSVKSLSLLQASSDSVLVVAAPLTHQQFAQILSSSLQNKWKMVIDLRRDAREFIETAQYRLLASQVVANSSSWIDLEQVMSFFSQQKDLLAARRGQALEAIAQWQQHERDRAVIRPFGWEDLCS